MCVCHALFLLLRLLLPKEPDGTLAREFGSEPKRVFASVAGRTPHLLLPVVGLDFLHGWVVMQDPSRHPLVSHVPQHLSAWHAEVVKGR